MLIAWRMFLSPSFRRSGPAVLLLLTANAPQPPPRSALERRLIALETASWQAWQRQDVPFWKGFLSQDHVELHGRGGPVGRTEVIDGIARRLCSVRSFAIDRFTFRRFGPDSAALVYRARQGTSCGGRPVPSPVWVTSFFQRRHGRWLNVFYSHTPLVEP